jgi:hypothetical protein
VLAGEEIRWDPPVAPITLDGVLDGGLAIRDDGLGGGTVVDADPVTGAWGAVLELSVDPPLLRVAARDMGEWLTSLFARHREVLRSLADIADDERVEVYWQRTAELWPTGPAVPAQPVEALVSSGDREVRAFAKELPAGARLYDLRSVRPGAWIDLLDIPPGDGFRRMGSTWLLAAHADVAAPVPSAVTVADPVPRPLPAVWRFALPGGAGAADAARTALRAATASARHGGPEASGPDREITRDARWQTSRAEAIAALPVLVPPDVDLIGRVLVPDGDAVIPVLAAPQPYFSLSTPPLPGAPSLRLTCRDDRLDVYIDLPDQDRGSERVAREFLAHVGRLQRAGILPADAGERAAAWLATARHRPPGSPRQLAFERQVAAALWRAPRLDIGRLIVDLGTTYPRPGPPPARLVSAVAAAAEQAEVRLEWGAGSGGPPLDEPALDALAAAVQSDPARVRWRYRPPPSRERDEIDLVLWLNTEPQESGAPNHVPGRTWLVVGVGEEHGATWDADGVRDRVSAAVGLSAEQVSHRWRSG